MNRKIALEFFKKWYSIVIIGYALLLCCYLYFYPKEKSLRQIKCVEIKTITEQKCNKVSNWLEERFANAKITTQSPVLLSAIPLNKKNEPVSNTILGYKGVFEGNNYRGEKVLSYNMQIHGVSWFIFAKIDNSEIYSEIYSHVVTILILTLGIILSIGFAVLWFYHSRGRNIFKELFLEKKIKQKMFAEREERFKILFDQAPIGYQSLNEDGNFIEVNETWLEMFGYTKEEVIGKWFGEFLAPEYVEQFKEKFLLFKTSNRIQCGFEILKKNGDRAFISFDGRVGSSLDGNLKQTHCVLKDITELKRANDKLIDSEKRLGITLETAQIGIWDWDLKNDKWYTSPIYYTMLGYTPEDSSDRKVWLERVHPEDRDVVAEKIQNVISNKDEKYQYEARMRHADGTYRWHSVIGSVVERDNSGKPTRLLGIRMDINDRKHSEETIQHDRFLLKTLINNLPDAIYAKDIQGRKTLCNKADLFNVGRSSEEEVLGKTDFDFFSKETADNFFKDDCNVIYKGISIINREESFIDKDGKKQYLLTSKLPLYNENKKIIGLLGIGRNITDIKTSEEQIITLSKVVAQSPVSVMITNPDGVIEYVNQMFSVLTQYSVDEVLGKKPSILKGDGTDNIDYKKLWESILAGNEWYGEFYNMKKNGEFYWEDTIISPILNEEGKIIHFVAIKEDTTERKKMIDHLRAAKEKAEQSDLLKTEFLSQMSHEIRSPLNAILSFANIIKDELDEKTKSDFFEYFDGIDSAGKRLIRTVDLILNTSEMQVGSYEPVFTKINLVDEIINKIRAEYIQPIKEKGLDFQIISNFKEMEIIGDKYSIYQVFENLVDNAIKYTMKGYIRISIEPVEKNEKIQVSIEDTGIGISDEFKNNLFKPFLQEDKGYSRRFDGNGLGLALVKKYCDLNGIKIEVESVKNKGSKFILNIPCMNSIKMGKN